MPSQLDLWLQQECRNESVDELVEKLARVRQSVRKIWEHPRLMWFTDHSILHSDRIVNILGQILSDLQKSPQRLSCYELYILMASCYLHDIGMQDFVIDGKGMEDFTVKDYELIRRKHPARAQELIIKRSISYGRDEFHIDLDDQPNYLVPIALICQGHGSEYFENSVEELNKMPYRPGGQKIRGDLLTALLMIGDELDLHEERARFPKEMDLSPISALHHHLHSYIAEIVVKAGSTSKERKICLSLNYPYDSSDYAPLLRDWIVNKLLKQLYRSREIIEQATNGELKLVPCIEIYESFDEKKILRPLPEAAKVELIRQTADLDMVNYLTVRQAIKNSVLQGEPPRVLIFISEDEQATAQLLKWVTSKCNQEKIPLFQIDFRFAPYSRYDIFDKLVEILLPADIKHKQSENLSESFDSNGELITEENDLLLSDTVDIVEPITPKKFFRENVRSFFESLTKIKNSRKVMVFNNLDILDTDTMQWFVLDLLRNLIEGVDNIPVLVTCRKEPHVNWDSLPSKEVHKLDDINEKDIEEHLRSVFGFDAKYAHEVAEDIFGTSNNGKPQGVFFAIRRMRLKGICSRMR